MIGLRGHTLRLVLVTTNDRPVEGLDDSRPENAWTDSENLRVVVAEDEALIRLDLAEMLEEAGFEVVAQAADGAEAVELVGTERPDVVIMDVKMPVLDGISAAEKIHAERIAPVT